MFFGNPSLFTRIVIGKLVGLGFGLIGFLAMPYFWPDAGWAFRLGILFWYPTVGAVIAVFGVMTWHPVLHLPLPWWVRAPMIGGWMNLLVVLLAGQEVRAVIASTFGPQGIIASPFWLVAEGVIVGAVIGYLCTRFGGEGKDTVTAAPAT